MFKIGSHISFKAPGYLKAASDEALSYGANSMMIYLGPPQSARRVEVERMQLEAYQATDNKIDINNVVVHAPYIINPASVEKWEFAKQYLIEEAARMNYLGLKYVVVHPGAYTKFTLEEGQQTLINTFKEVIKETKDVVFLIETMAGKGTELCRTFEEMKLIIDAIDSDRIGVCLDTCHIWDAGYNVQDADMVINQLKKTGLLDKIPVIHVNDSKNELGAHKDRHENIGKGYIGKEALKKFIHRPEFDNVIKILETPWFEGKPIYKEEIEFLK